MAAIVGKYCGGRRGGVTVHTAIGWIHGRRWRDLIRRLGDYVVDLGRGSCIFHILVFVFLVFLVNLIVANVPEGRRAKV
jgi:hypothetical protein